MKRIQNIPLGFFASLLLIATVVAGENKSDTTSHSSSKYFIIKSSCSSTPYPELCFSTIANSSEITNKLTNQKEVVMASLNLTTTAVKQNLFHIEKLIKKKWLTKREKTALHDCLETIDQALDDLHKAEVELNEFPNKKPLFNHADDLKTFLSSAITNHQTCLDGLSHNEADTKLRKAFLGSHLHVEKMFSNALAMTKNMTDTDMAVEAMKNGRLREEGYRGWPEWLLAEDRKLFLSPNVTPNVVVAADGSGDYRTVSAAVSAAPSESFWRYVIRIKAGVYKENVEVPKSKTKILFWGDGRKNTIITGDRNVQDGSTTFRSATVGVVGEQFLARDITFQNTAGPSKHQAVALRVGSDFSAFYQCDILGYQDTLYVHSNHQFYVNCLIAGTVDFIFGNAAVVFQDCDIHARRPGSKQKNMVTAQGRTDKNQNTGIVIQKCRIDGTSDLKPVKSSFPTYLGRPWKEYSRTIIMESYISDVVDAAGWHEWTGDFALNTLEYREYQNNGSGAGTTGRVNWTGYKVITNAVEASQYAPGMFIQGGSWLNSTTFPFSLGL